MNIVNIGDFLYKYEKDVRAEEVIRNPDITLYCIEPVNKWVVFVETPGEIKPSDAAFYYMAQYEHATHAYIFPYDHFHKLAKKIQLNSAQVIFIFSVGRCGSTLLSSVFNKVAHIKTLSEPDVFSQLALLRNRNGISEKEMRRLLLSCTKVLCKSQRENEKVAIKFRSFSIRIADILINSFGEAKNIFLYRDAYSWLNSAVRAFSSPSSDKIESVMGYGLSWLNVMETYMHLYNIGICMFTLRYKDLVENTEAVIRDLFNYCEIPVSVLGTAHCIGD